VHEKGKEARGRERGRNDLDLKRGVLAKKGCFANKGGVEEQNGIRIR